MIIERHFGDRVFYATGRHLYVDSHPMAKRLPGFEYTVISAPDPLNFQAAQRMWHMTRWRTISAGDHVEYMVVSEAPLTDEQIAWVRRHFPEMEQ